MESSSLFQPLDSILGRPSHVRLVRVLALHGGSLAPTELARRAGLSRRGAWNAIEALRDVGLLEPVGAGHSVPFRLRADHPLEAGLRRLFEEEAARADAVLAAVRAAANRLNPTPVAVWLFGSVARGEDRPHSDVDLALVADDERAARSQANTLRTELEAIGDQLQVSPSVISLSRAEFRRLEGENPQFWRRLRNDAVPLVGPSPAELD